MSFFAELKRRNVIRMAGLYLVGAWLIVQVAETLLPIYGTPAWVLKTLVALLALGFLPVLLFSWLYEMTPEGLRRDADVSPQHSIAPQTARRPLSAIHGLRGTRTPAQRMDRTIIVVLLLALGYFAFDKFVLVPGREGKGSEPLAEGAAGSDTAAAGSERGSDPLSSATATKAIAAAEKSIAVLPFADFSPGGDQQWFADGLSEEILNALARTPDLLVSARTSSFQYKGSKLGVPKIAAELGVAHVLEGSVRSTPQRIRVTAQLIRAADGFHLWSQNYDRDVADMIEVQEDLAREIAIAMQTSMDPEALADMAQVGTRSVEAYQAYIRGVAGTVTSEPSEYKAAYELFEQARQLDPAFAGAHARAAAFWLEQMDPTGILNGLTDKPPEEMARQFGERIDLAIRHAPGEIDRMGYRALKTVRELRLREALALYREYLAGRPGDAAAINELLTLATQVGDQALLSKTLDAFWPQAQANLETATSHANFAHRALDKRKAADQALTLLQRWPEQRSLLYQIHRALLWDGRVEEAAGVLERWLALHGVADQWSTIPPARQACAEGRRAEVETRLEALPKDDLAQRWHLLMLLGRTAEAVELLQSLERAGDTYALAGFLVYPQFDPTPFPSLMQLLRREKVERPPPLALPFACPPAKPAT